jgi:hypothetical protein
MPLNLLKVGPNLALSFQKETARFLMLNQKINLRDWAPLTAFIFSAIIKDELPHVAAYAAVLIYSLGAFPSWAELKTKSKKYISFQILMYSFVVLTLIDLLKGLSGHTLIW